MQKSRTMELMSFKLKFKTNMGIHWTDVPKLRINNMDNKRIYIYKY